MKKFTLFLSIAAITQSVHAGPMEEAVRQDKVCESAALIGKYNYQLKQSGKKPMTAEELGNEEILLYAANYGYNKATDLKDAHMVSWAHCHDAINALR